MFHALALSLDQVAHQVLVRLLVNHELLLLLLLGAQLGLLRRLLRLLVDDGSCFDLVAFRENVKALRATGTLRDLLAVLLLLLAGDLVEGRSAGLWQSPYRRVPCLLCLRSAEIVRIFRSSRRRVETLRLRVLHLAVRC